MIRVTPKMSDKPAPTKNRLDAAASPLSAWNRMASRLIAGGSRSAGGQFQLLNSGGSGPAPNQEPTSQHKRLDARVRRATRGQPAGQLTSRTPRSVHRRCRTQLLHLLIGWHDARP